MFEVGDLVVCVTTGVIKCPHGIEMRGDDLPIKGAVVRVMDAYLGKMDEGPQAGEACGCVYLSGAGWFGGALRFRKLNDEPDNASLIASIKACKPKKIEVPQRITTQVRQLDDSVWPSCGHCGLGVSKCLCESRSRMGFCSPCALLPWFG